MFFYDHSLHVYFCPHRTVQQVPLGKDIEFHFLSMAPIKLSKPNIHNGISERVQDPLILLVKESNYLQNDFLLRMVCSLDSTTDQY